MVLQGRAKLRIDQAGLGTNLRRLFWEALESGNDETGRDGTETPLRKRQGEAMWATGPRDAAYRDEGQVLRSGAGSSPT